MNEMQRAALKALCDNYRVSFEESNYAPQFDLPAGYVAGMVGPIYVGCSLEGEISS
jgi:hypothetical protein